MIFDWLESAIYDKKKESKFLKDCQKIRLSCLILSIFDQNKINKCTNISELFVEMVDQLVQKLKNKSIQTTKFDKVVILPRDYFNELVKIALCSFDYKKPTRIEDFKCACHIHEKKKALILLFGGTSGCGKSTLASLLAARLGITKVLSTDSVRHMLRTQISKEEYPELFASTYHAGEHIKDIEMTNEEKVIEGYKRQCRVVFTLVEKMIKKSVERNESLVVEGVHLFSDYCVELMKKYPCCIPYVIYISSAEKHKERFAIRAKYMTLDAKRNKYIKYFSNIRLIQEHICQRADAYKLPKVDNTSIDYSMATIQYSTFKSLKKLIANSPLFDMTKNVAMITPPGKPNYPWSSKRILKEIQRAAEKKKQFNQTTNLNSKLNGNNLSVIISKENIKQGGASSHAVVGSVGDCSSEWL